MKPSLGQECKRCGGTMRRQVVPCTDATHGIACTHVHVGYRCGFCGAIEDKTVMETTAGDGTRKRNLFRGEAGR